MNETEIKKYFLPDIDERTYDLLSVSVVGQDYLKWRIFGIPKLKETDDLINSFLDYRNILTEKYAKEYPFFTSIEIKAVDEILKRII